MPGDRVGALLMGGLALEKGGLMRSTEIVGVLMEAVVAVAKSHPHYGAFLLGEMAEKHGQLEILRLHTTGTGDRMVVRYAGDPHHVYELLLTPFLPDELADDQFMSRRPKRMAALPAAKAGVLERV